MRFCIQQSQKALQTFAENFERYSSKRSPNPFSALLEETETHEYSTPALAIHDREHNVGFTTKLRTNSIEEGSKER